MFDFNSLAYSLPSVMKPVHTVSFKEKLKWTGLVLILFFILGSITVWGVDSAAISHFMFLEIVFGSRFGSLITLGIGPIVTASIILQLLVGSKILDWDTNTKEGKEKFMSAQKLLAVAFCIFEAIAYVMAGAVPPASPSLTWIVIAQLALGGFLIILLDEVSSKWGIGSGVSLFIAAGVSKAMFVRIFAPPIKETSGGIISIFISSLSQGQPSAAILSLLPLLATITVFIIVVFAQSIKVEIPLAFSLPFGKFASRRWPLKFIYTSNIPVILTAAVLANLQVMGRMLYQKGITFLGEYDMTSGRPISGLMYYLSSPSSPGIMVMALAAGIIGFLFAFFAWKYLRKYPFRMAFLGGTMGVILGYFLVSFLNLPVVTANEIVQAVTYALAMIIGSMIFSIFWVQTSGMDAKSVASQFESSFLMIPGFRRDPRIIQRVLERYIPALTVLGGAFVGFLASFADLTNAVGTGTGILLTVMIVYQFYERIAQQHLEEMNPAVRKFMGR